MVDGSYAVPMLPGQTDLLNFERANAIEENLHYLIRQWPAFEAETTAEAIGEHGYLPISRTASPAEGAEVTLLQHLPKLLVILSGTGLDYLVWSGADWERMGGGTSQMILACTLEAPSEGTAMAALNRLFIGSSGHADIDISLAAERLDGTLRITRENVTRILFRAVATWYSLGAAVDSWDALSGGSWADARNTI